MGQQEGGFSEAGERAGEREDAFKFDEEDHDQKIEVQVKKKVSKQEEKTKVNMAGEPKE